MFRRWLQRSNRLSHADAEQRLQAIDSLSAAQAEKSQDMLVELLKADAEPAVRRAAALRVQSLDHLATQLDNDEISKAIAEIMVTRASSSGTPIPAACAQHPAIIEARLANAAADELFGLIEHISDPQQLAELAVNSKAAEREQIFAHPILRSEAGLNALEKFSRGKDKQCNRRARDQLEALKQTRQAAQQMQQRIEEIDSSISKELKHNPQQAEQVIAHRSKLRKLSDMRAEAVAQLQALRPHQQIAADPLLNVDLYIPQAGESPFDELCGQLTTLSEQIRAGADHDAIHSQRRKLANAWLTAADKFPPTATQHEQFEETSALFQQWEGAWSRYDPAAWEAAAQQTEADAGWIKHWQQQVKKLAWPEGCTPPTAVSTVREALVAAQASVDAAKAEQKSAADALTQLLDQAAQAIEDGKTRDAAAYLKQARAALATNASHTAQQRLQTLSAQLNELRDWQKYATSPKRQALVQQMQALAEAPLEPTVQSGKIRNLRQEWQALGPITSSADRALNDAFDEFAESAYAPCRQYYQAQQDLRAENLQQRKAICHQLQTYLDSTDWTNTDLKAADSILRTARDTWRTYHPCERKALKPVQVEFDHLTEQLYQHLKAGWDKNVNAKKDIIAQAQRLVEEDLQDQIQQAKQLQQAWREIGPTPRGVDQRLWRDFRQLCDDIFARRDADRQQHRAQTQARLDALEQAINALEAALQEDIKSFQQALDAVRDARQEVKPSQAQRQRIDAAEAAFKQQQQAAKTAASIARLQHLQDTDAQITQAEIDQQLSTLALDQPDALFTARLAGEAEPADWHRLAIIAEIAAEMPSSDTDQSLRMSIQVELMNDGVRGFDQTAIQELVSQWCSSGPKTSAQDPLRERFFAAVRGALNAAAAR